MFMLAPGIEFMFSWTDSDPHKKQRVRSQAYTCFCSAAKNLQSNQLRLQHFKWYVHILLALMHVSRLLARCTIQAGHLVSKYLCIIITMHVT